MAPIRKEVTDFVHACEAIHGHRGARAERVRPDRIQRRELLVKLRLTPPFEDPPARCAGPSDHAAQWMPRSGWTNKLRWFSTFGIV